MTEIRFVFSMTAKSHHHHYHLNPPWYGTFGNVMLWPMSELIRHASATENARQKHYSACIRIADGMDKRSAILTLAFGAVCGATHGSGAGPCDLPSGPGSRVNQNA
jgi:hypothetical protein